MLVTALQRFARAALLALVVLTVGATQPAFAAPGADFTAPLNGNSAARGELKAALAQFLNEQPDRFYALKSVDGLQQAISADRSYDEKDAVVLVDVRTPAEYAGGHIPTAVNIPVEELVDRLDEIPHDRTAIIYCSTGYRAAIAVEALHLLGYDLVQGFAPGYRGWTEAGEAIAK